MSSVPALSPPLQRLLLQVADTVQGVQAGKSLTELLARCPAELRPGTQALSFHVLRLLGSATAARAQLAPKSPPPRVDGLLVSAIALLWPVPGQEPAYADHVVVDQAVNAVRKRIPASAGFVNAVLRRFVRERETLVAAVQRDELGAWNHPAWWIERVRADWPEQWQAILKANNEHPPMTLRVNKTWGSAADYLARLSEAGLAARAIGELAPQAVVLERAVPVNALPGFAEGHVSVQDAAAQIAAPLLLGPDPELADLPLKPRLLDACSAPGGKTAHLLERAPDAELLALDADASRLVRVQDTLSRLGQRATLKAADGRQTAAWWDGQPFDAILLDAPCSASGIVRRHPDVRWLRRPGDIATLAQIQAELLDALWPTLKPGGRLVYATCSIFKAEGQAQIDAFLQRQGDAHLIPRQGVTGHLLALADNDKKTDDERQPSQANDGAPPGLLDPLGGPTAMRQVRGASLLDGFFYALLVKR